MDISKIIKEEIDDFDWIRDIGNTINHDDVIKGLQLITKWAGMAYRTDDEIGMEIDYLRRDVTQSNIESVIEVIERWHPYVEGDEVDAGLDYLKASLPITSKYYVNFDESLNESDDFDWIRDIRLWGKFMIGDRFVTKINPDKIFTIVDVTHDYDDRRQEWVHFMGPDGRTHKATINTSNSRIEFGDWILLDRD